VLTEVKHVAKIKKIFYFTNGRTCFYPFIALNKKEFGDKTDKCTLK